ncbi:hypothetical protein PCL_02298 [Purpureocillium lilacinum]|uniref:Uncharacterized protein n=1 Tax=Purpureocillium lilacinum TaxID=33203 RepID=A0A2U3E081_PURLI|nr:hypothetical protein PCL_02298 [Purpureocillium lilacinum]
MDGDQRYSGNGSVQSWIPSSFPAAGTSSSPATTANTKLARQSDNDAPGQARTAWSLVEERTPSSPHFGWGSRMQPTSAGGCEALTCIGHDKLHQPTHDCRRRQATTSLVPPRRRLCFQFWPIMSAQPSSSAPSPESASVGRSRGHHAIPLTTTRLDRVCTARVNACRGKAGGVGGAGTPSGAHCGSPRLGCPPPRGSFPGQTLLREQF